MDTLDLSMTDHLSMTEFEQQEFRKQGYVVLGNFFDDESVQLLQTASKEMSELARHIIRITQEKGLRFPEHALGSDDQLIVVSEASNAGQVCRYEFILGNNIALRDFFTSAVADVIGALLGEAVVPFKDKSNEKNPGGGGFGPHQDFAAYQAFPPCYHITAMIPIDHMTRLNGCVQFASNFDELSRGRPDFIKSMIDGHALLHYHDGGARNGNIRDDIVEKLEWRPVEVTPSDMVLFNSFSPHFSEPNCSAASRRAMFMTFNSRREGSWYGHYYREKRLNYNDPKFHISTPTRHA